MRKTQFELIFESLEHTLLISESNLILESHKSFSLYSPQKPIEKTLFNFKSKLLNINNLEKKSINKEKVSGIYFLYDNDELVYIGQTDFLYERISKHATDKKFDKFSFYPINNGNEKNFLEWFYIKKYKPRYNNSNNCYVTIKIGEKQFSDEIIFIKMNEIYNKKIEEEIKKDVGKTLEEKY